MNIMLLYLSDLHLTLAKSVELFNTIQCDTISKHNRKHMHNQGFQYKLQTVYTLDTVVYLDKQSLTYFENRVKICLKAV